MVMVPYVCNVPFVILTTNATIQTHTQIETQTHYTITDDSARKSILLSMSEEEVNENIITKTTVETNTDTQTHTRKCILLSMSRAKNIKVEP